MGPNIVGLVLIWLLCYFPEENLFDTFKWWLCLLMTTYSFISPLATLMCPITMPNVSIVIYSPSNETTYLIYSMHTYKPCMIVDVDCQATT